MEKPKGGTSSSIMQGATSSVVIKPQSQQQINQTSSSIEIEENTELKNQIEKINNQIYKKQMQKMYCSKETKNEVDQEIKELKLQIQLLKYQPTIIKANLVFDENYSVNIKKMLKELIKDGHLDPLRILNNEGITTDSLTKIDREKNIKIIKKLDEILELSKFDVNKKRILILNLKSENNKDDKSLKLVINLKNLYVQGFINNENQYFHFKEEKKNEFEIENDKKKLSDEFKKLEKYDEIFTKIENYNTFLKDKNLTENQKINTQQQLETAKQDMKKLLNINNNNWKNENQKIKKNMDRLENDIYWNQEKINIIKINEEVVKKYNCKKISLGYTEKYSKEGLDLKLENFQYKSILISKDILFNQTILNLANHTANENIKIKNDLTRITFVTSEAMRFGSHIQYFGNYKKGEKLVEFKNILEDIQKVINNNETIDWNDYAPQLIGGWSIYSKQSNEKRKEFFNLIDYEITYYELIKDFFTNKDINFQVKLNNETGKKIITLLSEYWEPNLELLGLNKLSVEILNKWKENLNSNNKDQVKTVVNEIRKYPEFESKIQKLIIEEYINFNQILQQINQEVDWILKLKEYEEGKGNLKENILTELEISDKWNLTIEKFTEKIKEKDKMKKDKLITMFKERSLDGFILGNLKNELIKFTSYYKVIDLFNSSRKFQINEIPNLNFDFFPLIENSIKVNDSNFILSTIVVGNKDILELILLKVKNINFQGTSDLIPPPLYVAVWKSNENDVDIVKMLLDHEADPNIQ